MNLPLGGAVCEIKKYFGAKIQILNFFSPGILSSRDKKDILVNKKNSVVSQKTEKIAVKVAI